MSTQPILPHVFNNEHICAHCGIAMAGIKEPGEACPAQIKKYWGHLNGLFNESGSKYLREIRCLVDGKADVYAVLEAFNVTCPARQHAIKKLLCSGIRGKGDTLQDLKEARDAIDRAIQMEESRK